jgi:hypothetical protein
MHHPCCARHLCRRSFRRVGPPARLQRPFYQRRLLQLLRASASCASPSCASPSWLSFSTATTATTATSFCHGSHGCASAPASLAAGSPASCDLSASLGCSCRAAGSRRVARDPSCCPRYGGGDGDRGSGCPGCPGCPARCCGSALPRPTCLGPVRSDGIPPIRSLAPAASRRRYGRRRGRRRHRHRCRHRRRRRCLASWR